MNGMLVLLVAILFEIRFFELNCDWFPRNAHGFNVEYEMT